MKKILIIMLFAIFGLTTTNIQAQTKQYYNIGWEISMPIGSYSDFVSETSLRGGFFSGNIFLTDAFSIGFKFGYNSYHENVDRQTYQINDELAVTAASYNYLVQAPIQVGGYYHFNLGTVEPYIGLGIGGNFISQETLLQDMDDYDNIWVFRLNPEIGLRFPIQNSPLAVLLKVGYDYNSGSYRSLGKEYNNFQNLNAGIALSWTIE